MGPITWKKCDGKVCQKNIFITFCFSLMSAKSDLLCYCNVKFNVCPEKEGSGTNNEEQSKGGRQHTLLQGWSGRRMEIDCAEWETEFDKLRSPAKCAGEVRAPRAFTDFKSDLVTGQTSVLGLWWYSPPWKASQQFPHLRRHWWNFPVSHHAPVLQQVSRSTMGVKEMK